MLEWIVVHDYLVTTWFLIVVAWVVGFASGHCPQRKRCPMDYRPLPPLRMPPPSRVSQKTRAASLPPCFPPPMPTVLIEEDDWAPDPEPIIGTPVDLVDEDDDAQKTIKIDVEQWKREHHIE
jgi:hypothetical protein